jgi:hypothetical protein
MDSLDTLVILDANERTVMHCRQASFGRSRSVWGISGQFVQHDIGCEAERFHANQSFSLGGN